MIVDLIEALYRLLWGDLFTLPVAGGCRYACSGI